MKAPIANCRLPIAGKRRAAARSDIPRRREPAICAPDAGRERGSLPQVARQRYQEAFTMIELMVVVGIIGLMAAMGLPSIFKALQKEGMRKAMSDVQDVCFSAREQAIIGNKIVAVDFYPRDRQFGVDGATSAWNVHSGRAVTATLPDGVEFGALGIYRRDYTQSDWAKIFFNPDGTSDEAVIVLVGKGGESVKLTLEYATGTPTVSAVDK